VDAFGRLVAEGLQGPEGPPGPGGTGELPPDPYEGAVLGWLNGGLAWVGAPPIPLPEGVFGPITEWDAQNGLLTVEGEIPSGIGNGVYVWQCNSDGTYVTEGWNTSREWSYGGRDADTQNTWKRAFNAVLTEAVGVNIDYQGANHSAKCYFDPPLTGSLRVNASNASGQGGNRPGCKVRLSTGQTYDVTSVYSSLSPAQKWHDFGEVQQVQYIEMTYTTAEYSGVSLYAIELNGEELVDTEYSLNLRVNQVLGQSLLGATNQAIDFTPGAYLYLPSQRVAPWVLYGNDPTSLIDHLRSS
jgi:hypothetical protein